MSKQVFAATARRAALLTPAFLLAAGLVVGTPQLTQAQTQASPDVPTTADEIQGRMESDVVFEENGARFVCTGSSLDSRQDPRWQEFPARLEFATAEGKYLGAVDVTVYDSAGNVVVQAQCLEPWLLVDAEPGQYRAEVTSRGHTLTETIAVPTSGQQVSVIHFPVVEG